MQELSKWKKYKEEISRFCKISIKMNDTTIIEIVHILWNGKFHFQLQQSNLKFNACIYRRIQSMIKCFIQKNCFSLLFERGIGKCRWYSYESHTTSKIFVYFFFRWLYHIFPFIFTNSIVSCLKRILRTQIIESDEITHRPNNY